MPTLIQSTQWEQVMRGLTAARLALYDAALEQGRADPRSVEQLEASRWLCYHRFTWHDDMDGYLRARPVSAARDLWERAGANKEAAKEIPQPISPLAPVLAHAIGRAVQDHQDEFFAVAGYDV